VETILNDIIDPDIECFRAEGEPEAERCIHARGRISQADVSGDEVWLMRFKEGRCVEYRECGTKERALEAAGLRE
jgi:hypothetical protein